MGVTSTSEQSQNGLKNLLELGKIGFTLGTIVFLVFFVFLMLGAGSSEFTITNQAILFYMFLSYSSGFGAIIGIIALNHPNSWVRRGFILLLFALPIVLEFGL